MQTLGKMKNVGNVFVIGGGQVYEESIKSGLVNKVNYTEVSDLPTGTEEKFDCWFPEVTSDEWECHAPTQTSWRQKIFTSGTEMDHVNSSIPSRSR